MDDCCVPQIITQKRYWKSDRKLFIKWEKLSTYTTNGILNINNNPVENAIRPEAIARKNFLFARSHNAAGHAAMIYSLFATCKFNNLHPYK